jgi:type IV pilus assembly protein PilW
MNQSNPNISGALSFRFGAEVQARHRQHGLTMIELLVAMVISLMIALAAVSALTVTRRGFSTVDTASQLRDNGRFAADLIQRLAAQSGYKDTSFVGMSTDAVLNLATVTGGAAFPNDPNITGFNNALFDGTLYTSTARTSGVVGYGSDILILRYQGVETFPGSGVSDGSMIDCAGNPVTTAPSHRYERMVSILHVAISQGEPALMCSRSATGFAPYVTRPLIQGVENFQVLYGTDGVVAGTAPTPLTAASAAEYQSHAVNRYFRADQMVVAGDPDGTARNWRLVRSLRIGMVLRGPANSQQEAVSQTFYPFGAGKSAGGAANGSAMSNTADINTAFTPTPDGRMRQVRTFTIQLRNEQDL